MGENKLFYAAVYRMTKAAYKRASAGDPEELKEFGDFFTFVREIERQTIQHYRSQGYTWEHIGSAFGLSRQAAFNRWGRK